MKANFVGFVVILKKEESHKLFTVYDSSFVEMTKAVNSSINPQKLRFKRVKHQSKKAVLIILHKFYVEPFVFVIKKTSKTSLEVIANEKINSLFQNGEFNS